MKTRHQDYYKALKIWPGVSQQVIDAAYHRLLRSPATAGDSQLVEEAYRVLGNPAAREAYDASMKRQSPKAVIEPPTQSEFSSPAVQNETPAGQGQERKRNLSALAIGALVSFVLVLLLAFAALRGGGEPTLLETTPEPRRADQVA